MPKNAEVSLPSIGDNGFYCRFDESSARNANVSHTELAFTHYQRDYTCRILSYDYLLQNDAVKSKKISALPCPVDAYLIDSFLCIFAEGSSSHPTMSAIDHLSKIWFVDASEMKVTWHFSYQMFRKVLVCSFYRKFQLKILLFGKWRDEVVQIQSRRIRKATLCKTLTYLERTESPLSPKVSLTTICDLCLLLRLPDRRGYFPLLCGSWLHFFCFSSFWTTEVDHTTVHTYIVSNMRYRTACKKYCKRYCVAVAALFRGCVNVLRMVRRPHRKSNQRFHIT